MPDRQVRSLHRARGEASASGSCSRGGSYRGVDQPAMDWNHPIAEKLIDLASLSMVLSERWHPLLAIMP